MQWKKQAVMEVEELVSLIASRMRRGEAISVTGYRNTVNVHDVDSNKPPDYCGKLEELRLMSDAIRFFAQGEDISQENSIYMDLLRGDGKAHDFGVHGGKRCIRVFCAPMETFELHFEAIPQ